MIGAKVVAIKLLERYSLSIWIGLFMLGSPSAAAEYGAVINGAWNDPATWTPEGGPPTALDNVYIGTGFPTPAITPATVQLTTNHSAEFVSIGNGTLELNGHSLAATGMLMNSSQGPAMVSKSGGHVDLEILLLFSGSKFSIETGDALTSGASVEGIGSALDFDRPISLIDGVSVSDGGVVNTSATLTALGFGVQIAAATVNAGADITASSTFHGVGITSGGVLNLNGHSLTAGVLYLGSGTFQVIGGLATLNRGSGGNIQLGSIDVNSGNTFVLEAVDDVSESIRVAGIGSALHLNRDIAISGLATVRESGTLDLNGRLLSASGSIALLESGRLTGTGAVLGNVQNDSGVIAPGGAIGILSIDGSFDQDEDGILEVELSGTDNSNPLSFEFDQLVVDGTASLSGGLAVDLASSFTPGLGDVFPIITATGGAQFTFDSISLPALSAGLEWQIDDSSPQSLLLRVVSAFVGDYNGNGTVDAADYTVWRNSRGQTGTGLTADGNRNGVVNDEDYAIWKQNFGATSGAGTANSIASVTVAETKSISLIAIIVATAILKSFQSQSARQSSTHSPWTAGGYGS